MGWFDSPLGSKTNSLIMKKIFALLKYIPGNPLVEGDRSIEWSMVYAHGGEVVAKVITTEKAEELIDEYSMICVLKNNSGAVYELPERSFAAYVKANDIAVKGVF